MDCKLKWSVGERKRERANRNLKLVGLASAHGLDDASLCLWRPGDSVHICGLPETSCTAGPQVLLQGQSWQLTASCTCEQHLPLWSTSAPDIGHVLLWLSFALCKWKDKYLFKEQMPAAHGPCLGPQLQSGWEIALLGAQDAGWDIGCG